MQARIEAFLDLLFKWNKTYRLTAFESKEEAQALGVEPSLSVCDDLPLGTAVLDVGSGGGFPAIPLAIARPDLSWVLTEPSRQKAAFLREAIVALGLSAKVVTVPVEVLLNDEGGPWGGITVRGVNLRHGVFKRIAKAVAPNGVLAIWSGGEREERYALWAAEAGLAVQERILPTTPPVILLLGRVPRGTPPVGVSVDTARPP